MSYMAGKEPLEAGNAQSTEMPDLGTTPTTDQESESCFVHHRRSQRFLGKDTSYSRRPDGRM